MGKDTIVPLRNWPDRATSLSASEPSSCLRRRVIIAGLIARFWFQSREVATSSRKENMKHFLAIAALICHTSVWAHSVAQDYKVVAVLDGGTVKIAGEGKELTCRLYGIVIPETDLVYGQASRESLSELTYGHKVHVHIINTVRPGTFGCRVLVDGNDISREQVRRGMAWKFRGFTIDAQLLHVENNAKSRRLGLWSDPDLTLQAP
jgi:micrococcal nuclease